MESEHGEHLFKVFHKFFIVNPAVTIDISTKTQCNNFLIGEVQAVVLEASYVLVYLKEPILISIIFFE